MNITRKALVAATAGLALLVSLTGCTQNEAGKTPSGDSSASSQAASDKSDQKAEDKSEEEGAVKVNSRPEECGLQEQEGPSAKFGPFDGSIAYFQPGEMAPNPNSDMKMLDYKQSQMHLELDLKANAFGTNWGYSKDETPANLHIMYQLSNSNGKVLSAGMFMPMNAIDGSHYGTNLPKDTITEPGTYKMKLTLYPPHNYDMHADYITGVPAEKWFGPLSAVMDWKLTKKNLDIIKKNTVEDFMNPSEKCKKYPKKMFKNAEDEKAMKEAEAIKPLPMKMDKMEK